MWIKNDIQWSYPCGGDVSPNYEDNSESSETVNKFNDLFVYLPNHVDELTVSPQQKELRFILTFLDFFPTPALHYQNGNISLVKFEKYDLPFIIVNNCLSTLSSL